MDRLSEQFLMRDTNAWPVTEAIYGKRIADEGSNVGASTSSNIKPTHSDPIASNIRTNSQEQRASVTQQIKNKSPETLQGHQIQISPFQENEQKLNLYEKYKSENNSIGKYVDIAKTAFKKAAEVTARGGLGSSLVAFMHGCIGRYYQHYARQETIKTIAHGAPAVVSEKKELNKQQEVFDENRTGSVSPDSNKQLTRAEGAYNKALSDALNNAKSELSQLEQNLLNNAI